MRYVVGVDMGGSKCDALVADEHGCALSWGHVDIHDPRSGRGDAGSGRSIETIRHAVSDALHGISCDELHVNILNAPAPQGLWQEIRAGQVVRHATDEWRAAFTLAGETSGIVALAGTGAFVHGLTRDGRKLHLDGLGPYLGDYGSGYHIGNMAIRAAARSGWHPRHKTVLAERITGVFERRIPRRYPELLLIDFMHNKPDRAEIAALVPMVVAAANEGDTVARRILDEAAEALAETTRDVVDRLDLRGADDPLIGTGGVVTHLDSYWEHYCAAVRRFAPRLRPVRLSLPAAAGVVLATLLELRGGNDGVRETLLRTTRELLSRRPTPALNEVPR